MIIWVGGRLEAREVRNDLFAYFESTDSKSRLNFLTLLRGPTSTGYTIDDVGVEYGKQQKLSPELIVALQAEPREFVDAAAWKARLAETGRRAFSALPNRHSHGGSHGFESSSAHLLAVREMEPLVRRSLHPVFAAFSQLFPTSNLDRLRNCFPGQKGGRLARTHGSLGGILGE